MNIRGVILEGYSNAGKTSLLKAIKQSQALDESAELSVVILGEHYSQILNNVQGKFVRLSRGLFFILERFHLNHRVAFSDSDDAEITSIEHDLIKFGAKCLLLTISDDIVEERIKSRNPEVWINKSREEIDLACKELIDTQNSLRIQASKSKVPTIEINTDDKEWDKYAGLIMEDNDFVQKNNIRKDDLS